MEKEKSVGAIWVKESKGGMEYFSIVIDEKRYVAFPNKKTKNTQPDFRIYASKPKETFKQSLEDEVAASVPPIEYPEIGSHIEDIKAEDLPF